MNRYSMKALLGCVAAVATLSTAGTALAVPYASAVVQTGSTVDYILNEPATSVTVTFDVGAPAVQPVTAGAHSVIMPVGATTYSIAVDHTAAAGWTQSASSIANSAFLNFERPNGVQVNKNPGSANFGNIYVGNRSTLPAASGRLMGDGIYILNATGVNSGGELLNDTTAAKNGGDGLAFTASSNSPWRMSIGPDDNLYIADWSNATGGVKVMSPDGSTIANLLDVPGDAGANTTSNHGSVVSKPIVSGSLGVDLTVWTMDEDLQGSVAGTGNHVWRYDVGTDTAGHVGAATLVLDASTDGTNSDGSVILFDLNIGVDADISRDEVHGNWIINQPRNDGNETGLLILGSDVNGNPDMTNVLFNSKQFTIDNGMDGAIDDILFPEFDGTQDIFRFISRVEVSPDGSTMVVHRRSQGAENVHLGLEPVFLMDLDANGVPILDVSDIVGNPGLGITEIAMASQSNGSRKTISYDLAGNLYAGSNADEQIQIWGPGGVSSAITASDGTFTINGVTYGGSGCSGITGDLDCDGFVGITDLNIVLGNWNLTVPPGDPLADPSGDGFVGIDDLNQVLGNWNAGTPPPPGTAVPEPATLALLSLGGFAILRRR